MIRGYMINRVLTLEDLKISYPATLSFLGLFLHLQRNINKNTYQKSIQ